MTIKRDDLGPTGPAKLPKDGAKKTYDEKHPHAGNVDNGGHIGPTPTDDPRHEARKLEKTIDKKRPQTPAD
jgi:hypothetical protein